MTRALLLLVALPLVASCHRADARRDAGATPLPLALRNRPAAPSAAPTPPVAVDSGLPGYVLADVITFDNGQRPAQTFEGPGASVVVGTDGTVTVRSPDVWDGGFEQAYESCVFARNALVQLRRSLPPASVELIVRACGEPRPGERPPTLRPAPAPARR
jgi:hypothetical protein